MIKCKLEKVNGSWQCKRCKRIVSTNHTAICTSKPVKHGTCEHFDTYTGESKVFKQCCGKRDIKLKIFKCQVHGKCTMTGKLPKIQSCESCPDYKCMECDFSKGNTCPKCGTTLENFDPSIPVKRECYTKAPQMIYYPDGTKARLRNFYREKRHGSACFYIGGGPSLLQQNLDLLRNRPFSLFAVNNVAAKLVRPDFWCCGDEPKSFHDAIWRDAGITKFVPSSKGNKHFYFKEDGLTKNSGYIARNAPNTYQYDLIGRFNHKTFLSEDGFSWGCDKGVKDSIGIGSGRSVMLVAMKMMWYLGFRRIYLLGCDFNMQHDKDKNGRGITYAFPQYKHLGGCKTNNDCYEIMNKRFMSLRPIFEENNFQVINCTPNSNLDAFDCMDYEEAIAKETMDKVDVKGMYG